MNINIFIIILALVSFFGCGSTLPNRMPEGEQFPRVSGTSLAGGQYVLPDSFKGKPVILILAYDQNAQFDIDRWGVGFFTADLDLPPVYEIPTIPGLIPSLLKERIDGGMRKGIPQESWKDVVTVYGSDGKKLAEWTGTENPRNARVVLLDEEGKVVWFHDRGYGLPPLQALRGKLEDREKSR
jgi:hypothetical protein